MARKPARHASQNYKRYALRNDRGSRIGVIIPLMLQALRIHRHLIFKVFQLLSQPRDGIPVFLIASLRLRLFGRRWRIVHGAVVIQLDHVRFQFPFVVKSMRPDFTGHVKSPVECIIWSHDLKNHGGFSGRFSCKSVGG